MKIPTLLLRLNGISYVNFHHWIPKSLSFLSLWINYLVVYFIVFGVAHVIALFSWHIYSHESEKVDNLITTANHYLQICII